MQLHLFHYDIPEAVKGDCANPSVELRRVGMRLTLSCWLIRGDRIPHHTIARLNGHGVRPHLHPFAAEAVPGLLDDGVAQMVREIRAALQSLRATIANRPAVDATPAQWTAYDRRCAQAQRRHEQALADWQEAARTFGVEDRIDFALAADALADMQLAQAEIAGRYVQAANALPADDLLARAARVDLVPAEVLADYCQDRDLSEGIELAESLGV